MIAGGSITLHVRDVARAVRFYVETLGMKLVREAPDGSATIDAGEGFQIVLRQGGAPGATAVTLHAKVPLSEAIAIFENRGVTFTTEPIGGATVARFRDPDGNELALTKL